MSNTKEGLIHECSYIDCVKFVQYISAVFVYASKLQVYISVIPGNGQQMNNLWILQISLNY